MSTSCVFPSTIETAFRLAKECGFDGVEVMITAERATRSASVLRALSDEYRMPILSVHAPVLLLTQLVWGVSPLVKLERSARLAVEVGATTVVVHPPFRWQASYAGSFLGAVRRIAGDTSIEIAVENMFPWGIAGRPLGIYAPGYDPSVLDCDAMTLDFSHAALAGQDALDLALRMGDRLRHVHLTDGTTSASAGRTFDQHLVPGHGTQPVAEVLAHLSQTGWSGSIVAEVANHGVRSEEERIGMLAETLHFARTALTVDASAEVPVAR